ncbi:MAG: NUDIX hydrolase [Armatimonadetes bacterium]|nr:NUDIX hydrolase [Armatimonadota bacterium]MDE2206746.1 NUDIX hydrolase [Armatimonadota bacterium]
MSYERVRSRDTMYRGIILSLDRVTVQLEDGREAIREIVRHDGAVCIVPVLDDASIVFVRQFRLAAAGELLEIPAGKLEAGEDPAEAAARELSEETGYRAGKIRKLGSYFLAPGYSTELMHTYLATSLTPGETQPDEDEHVSVEIVPAERITEMIAEGAIRDAKTLAALMLARIAGVQQAAPKDGGS